VHQSDDLISTQHFIHDESNPLWRFSDAGMHHQCFVNWPLRNDFVQQFNRFFATRFNADDKYQYMQIDGTIEWRARKQADQV
jgi:hypothetical protein